jgi:hypothetical protein
MALTNRIGLVEYDVAGPTVVHERMILDHVIDDYYIVATPDQDVYCEQMSPLNGDLRAFRIRPSPNQLPPGVVAAEVYGLPAWDAATLAGIRAQATSEAAAEKARRGLGGGALVPAQAVQPAAPAAAASSEHGAPGARDISGDAGVWVAAETDHGFVYGQKVDGVTAVATISSKHLHPLPNGLSLFVMCIDQKSQADFNNRPALCDGRINGRKMNLLGSPERTLAEAAAACSEYDLGWTLTGPRTTKWCLSYLAIEGLGLEAHHERFRTLCKLESSTWGVVEHFQLSMFLRQLIQVDCLNCLNSLGIELMFRRLQTIEFAHGERAREAEAKTVGGKLSIEEQATFGAIVRQAGTLMVAPALLDYVKGEVEKDVALQKGMRKAREERES